MGNFKNDDATVNALFEAMGAMVMALSDVLTPEQKERFAANLARFAQSAERAGKTTLETALIDLHRAARL